MTKGELAKEYFESGCNCAQAVLLAFCDDFGLDKDTALMIAAPFGGGMGRLREVCGAVSGMNMALGLAKGRYSTEDNAKKAQLYSAVQELAGKFREANGSIICRELLGLRIKEKDAPAPECRTESYYKSRPCAELCRCAADILEEYFKTDFNEKL